MPPRTYRDPEAPKDAQQKARPNIMEGQVPHLPSLGSKRSTEECPWEPSAEPPNPRDMWGLVGERGNERNGMGWGRQGKGGKRKESEGIKAWYRPREYQVRRLRTITPRCGGGRGGGVGAVDRAHPLSTLVWLSSGIDRA